MLTLPLLRKSLLRGLVFRLHLRIAPVSPFETFHDLWSLWLFFKGAMHHRFVSQDSPLFDRFDEGLSSDAPVTYVLGLRPWRSFFRVLFPGRKVVFLPRVLPRMEFEANWQHRILADRRSEIVVWGIKFSPYLDRFVRDHGVKIWYVEDGFLRSVGLGASKTPPFSLTVDSRAPHFDAQNASDLEVLLNTFDFAGNAGLRDRAARFRREMIRTGLSKYNHAQRVDIETVYGVKTRRRVLVVGQVEDDASILLGCARRHTNRDAVMIACAENPDSEIIYKPHPDVMHGYRRALSRMDRLSEKCVILERDLPLAQSFETVDHVYTITSQAGFEALMREIPVTTLGCPFYSGWGLTDDRQPNARRKRILTLDELVAAVYLLYPKYFDPLEKREITAEEALERLAAMRDSDG